MGDSTLLRRAKAIQVPDRFVNTIIYLIEELFENRVYPNGRDDQKLGDIVRRDLTYRIDAEQWGREGAQFQRSGGMPLSGLVVTFETNPDKQVAANQPRPVLYRGAYAHSSTVTDWPHLFFTINGNLTKGEAMRQFDPHSPEYRHLQTVVKHELMHIYDRQQIKDMSGFESQEQFDQPEVYFNVPTEVRAWTGNLIDEFKHFISGQRGPVENRLVSAFLKDSRIWGLLSQHLNAANRRYVLHELSRELEALKGRTNARPASKVDQGNPVGR